MTSSLTQNHHFEFNGATRDLASSPDTTSLSPFAESVKAIRRKRNRSFRRALLQRRKDYSAAGGEAMLGRNQKLDFHRNALHAQSKEIALVANYGLSDKQHRDLYNGLGYTGLHRFLEESGTAIFTLSTVVTQAESPTYPSEPEVVEATPQPSPEFEVEVGNVCVATQNPCRGVSFVVVGKY